SFRRVTNAVSTGHAHLGASLCGSPAIQATSSIAQTPSSRRLCEPFMRATESKSTGRIVPSCASSRIVVSIGSGAARAIVLAVRGAMLNPVPLDLGGVGREQEVPRIAREVHDPLH